jgi:hypothetical protein
VTVATGSSYSIAYGNAGSTYDYIYLSNTDNPSWLDGKALPVANVQASTLEVTLPTGNAWTTVRPATSGTAGAGNAVTITADVEGLTTGDYVYMSGANVAQFDSNPYQVTGVGSTSFTIVESNVTVAVTGGLDYTNYGTDNSGANVQIVSTLHGLPEGATLELIGSSNTSQVANGNATLQSRVSEDTFFITAVGPVTEAVTGTANINLDATTASHTPVNSIDLSNATTIAEAVTVFNNIPEFPSLNAVPGTSNRVYISTKPSFDSVSSAGIEFTLHEDSVGTIDALSLTTGSKTRSANTIKAKLERWLNTLVNSKDLNLISSAQVNDKWSNSGV